MVDVLRLAVITPLASVGPTVGSTVPAVVVNVTGADGNGLPFISNTLVVIVDTPPRAGIRLGLADTLTRPTAAVPIAILTALAVPLAPPEIAEMVAVPFAVPARNVTTTRPPTSVDASAGSTLPNVVVKVTCVPL